MPTTKISTYIVDSFTKQAFKGNPAGVCLLEKPLTETQMLNIANELGFSETAFVYQANNATHYNIRFFSPKTEIDLCGHATLASAKVIFNKKLASKIIYFKNINDVELIVRQDDNNADNLCMEFPAYQTQDKDIPQAMLQALGLKTIVNSAYNDEINSLLIEIEDSETLANLTPNFDKLIASYQGIDGVVITAPSTDKNYDFQSRYFWGWVGTDEDAVTGVIHLFLATYWAKKLGKKNLSAFQCSERGGSMQLQLTDNNRVIITGQAQIILEGSLFL